MHGCWFNFLLPCSVIEETEVLTEPAEVAFSFKGSQLVLEIPCLLLLNLL